MKVVAKNMEEVTITLTRAEMVMLGQMYHATLCCKGDQGLEAFIPEHVADIKQLGAQFRFVQGEMYDTGRGLNAEQLNRDLHNCTE